MSEETTNEFEVTTGLGKIKAKGTEIIQVIMVCCLVLLSYMQWDHKVEAKEDKALIASTLAKNTEDQLKALKSVATAQEELGYIVSLTPEKKAELNLEMPESLRNKMRGR